ncbi:hypothetical protein F5J12DRAFT_859972 [Pisolithus orientalis]|uniref:uncharacterized protein n=1 Tax=Pisolithus orientalis TaxID=936130 RepID=UPI0022257E75|nr:uncharacterized protein F5J12DRAFT_859972 [Pisolithus orientalis]KAI5992368.1 hypothetical protein F5J12DRAFT_859972 [Pisolithus orientalis]
MRVLTLAEAATPTPATATNTSTTGMTGTTETDRADCFPTVTLDTERVTHDLAARLATTFLAHVLFLKNQIPFPVAQLARIPDKDTRSRAAKKRQQLLNSFDTLTSHLYTTFVALSTSLALRRKACHVDTTEISRKTDIDKVFLAIVLGPTIGTAKSRLIMGIDGFEVKVWGLRDDVTRSPMSAKTVECSHMEHDDESEESDNHESEGEDVETDDSTESPYETGEESTEDQPSSEDGEEDSSGEEPPPPSRSPSPSPTSSPPPPPLAPPLEHAALPRRHEETDDTLLRTAERLLSFTLAKACAEDVQGQGIAAELPPTNIHILIRAPRRFTHPAWIPRQPFSPALDDFLDAFLDMSADSKAPKTLPTTTGTAVGKQQHRKGNVRVEGIWARARRSGSGYQSKALGGVKGIESESEPRIDREAADADVDEQDELIWWGWDGKLTGFTDW